MLYAVLVMSSLNVHVADCLICLRYTISYTDYWQYICAHIHGVCSYATEAILQDFVHVKTIIPRRSPPINRNAKKLRALTGSTFGNFSRFRPGLKTKQRLKTFLMTQCSLQSCLCLSPTKHGVLCFEAVRSYTGSAHI